MYKTLVNNRINYLPTVAGFLPSTVSLVPSWEPHYPKKHVPTIRFPLTSSQGKETWWKDVISPPHQSQFNQFSGEKVITTVWITFENYVYISNSFLEVWALELQQMFCLSPGGDFTARAGWKIPPTVSVRRLGGCGHGADFGMIFFGEQEMPPPKMKKYHLKRDHFKRKGLSSIYHFSGDVC